MAGRPKGKGNATIAQIRDALTVLAQHESADEAGRELGISGRTLRQWRQDYPDVYAEICQVLAAEVRERHAKGVRKAWQELREVADMAMEMLRAGNFKDANEFRALAATVASYANAGYNVARLDADQPTVITEQRSVVELRERLLDLAEEHGWTLELPELDQAVIQ